LGHVEEGKRSRKVFREDHAAFAMAGKSLNALGKNL